MKNRGDLNVKVFHHEEGWGWDWFDVKEDQISFTEEDLLINIDDG